MVLVQYFSDGSLVFNWELLPEQIRQQIDIRDKIFNELQEKMKVNDFVTTKALCELNRYAMQRIKAEIKNKSEIKETNRNRCIQLKQP
jgi:hypothetical protein